MVRAFFLSDVKMPVPVGEFSDLDRGWLFASRSPARRAGRCSTARET